MNLENKELSINILKYNDIMARYRNGEFGNNHLTLREILNMAGEPDLLNNMTIDELEYLALQSSGMLKSLFSKLQKEKLERQDNIEILSRSLTKNNIK